MTLSVEDLERIRQVVREELAAARHADNLFNDQAYLVATTTPQERNAMARQQRAAEVAAAKAAAGTPLASMPSIHDEVMKMMEDKRRSLAEKRAKRAAKLAAAQEEKK